MNRVLRISAWAIALLTTGCAEARFANRPPVWRVADENPIDRPDERPYGVYGTYGEIFLMKRVDRALSLPDSEVARNVNSLDEVPDSTWFENRIGMRDLTPAEVALGPGGELPVLPFKVKRSKAGGTNVGFVVEDQRGDSFLVKFDLKAYPEMQTANAAIGSRLFWAAGYHVPSEHVVTLDWTEFILAPDAIFETPARDEEPFTEARLHELLRQTSPQPDGRYRVLVSRFLPGKPIGGHVPYGTRSDDPNDRIPHEHRRELRGLRVFAAWLDHSDINEANTLDVYIGEPKKGFVRHYLVDFGEMLGAHHVDRPWVGYANFWDWEYQMKSLFALGLWKRPWESEPPQPLSSVGLFFPSFNPDLWREGKPYFPFYEMTPEDAFWAAKIAMRFRKRHIEAAVATGKLSDPRASAYLVDTLEARRNVIGRRYLEAVTPLDAFRVQNGHLCATDLSMHWGLATDGVVETLDDDGDVTARVRAGRGGEVCVPVIGSGYTVVRMRTVRGNLTRAPIEVHLANDIAPRILGVRRTDDEG